MAKAKTSKKANPVNTGSVVANQAQALPMDIFKKSPQGGALVGGGSGSPYVQFFHDRANNSQQVVQSLGTMEQGDPFLVRTNGFVKLDPLAFIVTETYYQYWAKVDSDSQIIEALLPEGDTRPQWPWVEFIEALIFVVVSSKEICCARMRMRGPKCKGFKQAIDNIDAMRGNEDWAKETKDNMAASKSGLPDWAWLTHIATITDTPPKNPKKPDGTKAQNYDVMSTAPKTTSVVVMDTLIKCLKDADYGAGCRAAQGDLMGRWESEIVAKVKK